MTSIDQTKADILEAVATMIQEVIGEEWALEKPITMETTFSYDLEVESIELVSLAEKIQQRYGAAVDFAGWLSGMELEAIINLTVGELVDYIASCL